MKKLLKIIRYTHWILWVWGMILSIVTIDNYWWEFIIFTLFIMIGILISWLLLPPVPINETSYKNLRDEFKERLYHSSLYSSQQNQIINALDEAYKTL